jgi:hypothetical protein
MQLGTDVGKAFGFLFFQRRFTTPVHQRPVRLFLEGPAPDQGPSPSAPSSRTHGENEAQV